MRVTQNMLNNNMLLNVNDSLNRMSKQQEMLSTGRKVNRPSDDPIAAIRGVLYRTNISENLQLRKNTDEAFNWLEQSEKSIGEGVSVLTRVKELLTQAANDTYGPEERDKIMGEIENIRDHLGSIANTRYVDKYIFNGEQTLTPPYDENTKQLIATGNVNPNKNLNNKQIELEVSVGIKIPINVQPGQPDVPGPGADGLFYASSKAFDPAGTTEKRESVFETLKNVMTDLKNSDSSKIRQDLEKVQAHIDNFLQIRARAGAAMNRIELTQDRLDTQNYGNEKMLSDAEDADLAKVIMDLQNNENIHRAALSAGSRIIQPTLMDFLR